jgi:tRNA pseudouridine55 synthase
VTELLPDDSSAPAEGLVVVDKPTGWTSHDVVGRLRRLAHTRKVGHAGTLDPMATGVLVCGVGRATRLLGHVSGADKSYVATIRLGQRTVTDDADGDVVGGASAAGIDETEVSEVLAGMVGTIEQVPSAVSAIKVDGKRSYARVRAGEEVTLRPRSVTISQLVIAELRRPTDALLDLDVSLSCSTGTYVRAVARDLGAALGVGGHLTMLRRTRVGGFGVDLARSLEQLQHSFEVVPLAAAVRRSFPVREVSDGEAQDVRYGRSIDVRDEEGVVGVFDSHGQVLALAEPRSGRLRVVAGFTAGQPPGQ